MWTGFAVETSASLLCTQIYQCLDGITLMPSDDAAATCWDFLKDFDMTDSCRHDNNENNDKSNNYQVPLPPAEPQLQK